jgi:hypothetical protein
LTWQVLKQQKYEKPLREEYSSESEVNSGFLYFGLLGDGVFPMFLKVLHH